MKNDLKKDYQKLLIWQKAQEIFEMVCIDIKSWPNSIIARSISYQLIDSAGSMGANIAEGYGRGGPKEFEQFMRYSRGSSAETDNWLFKALSNDLITNERYLKYQEKFKEFHLMTAAFIYRLRTQNKTH